MKKGQEEIVGFVAIIVVISIVSLFFIGLSLRSGETREENSKEIEQFIESANRLTTNCELGTKEKYSSLSKLGQECYRNSGNSCFDGSSICETYNVSLKKAIDGVWKVSEEGPVKGYIWNLTYEKSGKTQTITSLQQGICIGEYKEEESLSPDPLLGGTFLTKLRICT